MDKKQEKNLLEPGLAVSKDMKSSLSLSMRQVTTLSVLTF